MVLVVAGAGSGGDARKQLLSWWRWAVIGITLVAAIFTPSGDPFSMLALAIPADRLLLPVDPHREAARGGERPRPCARAAFEASLSFELGPLPGQAIDAIDDDANSVLVERAHRLGQDARGLLRGALRARARARKAFYTTPLKALSNQKFTELVAEHGARAGRPAHRRRSPSAPGARSS